MNENSTQPESVWTAYFGHSRVQQIGSLLKRYPSAAGKTQVVPPPTNEELEFIVQIIQQYPSRLKHLISLVAHGTSKAPIDQDVAASTIERTLTALKLPFDELMNGSGDHVPSWNRWLSRFSAKKFDEHRWMLVWLSTWTFRQTGAPQPEVVIDILADYVQSIAPSHERSLSFDPGNPSPVDPRVLDAVLVLATSRTAFVNTVTPIIGELHKIQDFMRFRNDQQEAIASLSDRIGTLSSLLHEEREQIAKLKSQLLERDAELQESHAHAAQLRDGIGLELRNERGRLRAAMEENIRRIQTALDAATSDPPRITVVNERLTDVIAALRRIGQEPG